jgi:dihydroxyacetone kinase-like protein
VSAKLLNDPFRAVDEMLAGVACAHAGRCELLPGGRALVTRERSAARRVAVITGGGSGHEPAFFGFLGPGLADGVAVGNVFASPSARPVAELVRHLQPPDGALFVYGNYEGDVMNFGLAAELLADEGVPSETVLVTDDVASAPRDQRSERRGVAGGLIVLKAAGARADEGAGLAAVAAAARLANERTRTIGIGLAPCTLPTAEAPTFELAEGEMDVGMGVHGEAGIERSALRPADEVADLLLELILADRQPERGEPVHALVNTLGATTMMEGYVLLRRVAAGLAEREIPLRRAVVGEYITSLEMAGLSLTITALNDDLARWLAAPAAPLAGVDPWRYAA